MREKKNGTPAFNKQAHSSETGFRELGETPHGASPGIWFTYILMNDFTCPPAGNPAADILPSQPDFHRRILVVVAAEDLRQLNAEILMGAGYEVELVEDGAAAWAALQLHRYDLRLTDQSLSKLSGVELLKKILTARMTLPIGALPPPLHPKAAAIPIHWREDPATPIEIEFMTNATTFNSSLCHPWRPIKSV